MAIRSVCNYHRILTEGTQLAKQLVAQNKLTLDDFNKLKSIDPSKQKFKYVDWMAKQWVSKAVTDIDDLRNTIEEFDAFLNKGKTKNKDIQQYQTFADVKVEVDHLNNTGEGMSVKDLENDYEIIRDDADLLIMCPHTHEASRKLGLSHFAYRDCKEGGKDSAWCTTYKAPDHFNSYYYSNNVTFYYIKVRSTDIQQRLQAAGFHPEYFVTAIAVLGDDKNRMDAYDATDSQFDPKEYLQIIGVS